VVEKEQLICKEKENRKIGDGDWVHYERTREKLIEFLLRREIKPICHRDEMRKI